MKPKEKLYPFKNLSSRRVETLRNSIKLKFQNQVLHYFAANTLSGHFEYL